MKVEFIRPTAVLPPITEVTITMPVEKYMQFRRCLGQQTAHSRVELDAWATENWQYLPAVPK